MNDHDATTRHRLFPADLPRSTWIDFKAPGHAKPVTGVVYSADDAPGCGVPLGGLGTGCVDLDCDGRLGYSTLFSHVWGHDDGEDGSSIYRDRVVTAHGTIDLDDPTRGKLEAPFLGLAVGAETWALTTAPVEGARSADRIEYWGHYPIADLEFRLDGPVQVALRAWSPFVPGDAARSNTPMAVFECRLRNVSETSQSGSLVMSLPAPHARETDGEAFARRAVDGDGYSGAFVETPSHVGYVLAALDTADVRLGPGLVDWSAVASGLPAFESGDSSSDGSASVAVDFELEPGGDRVIRFLIAWYAPQWIAGWPYGSNERRFTKMYTTRFADAAEVADYGARNHVALIESVVAWQDVVYADESIPGWLRDGLVNSFHLIPECAFWASPRPPLGDWCFPDGVFSLVESTTADGQQTCIPCDWYGNLPIVYFFPEVARTTLRALSHFMREDGAVPFDLGQGLDLVDHQQYDRQRTLNGCCFVDMVGRLWRRTGDDSVLEEFFPTVKASIEYMVGLVPGPAGVISTAGDQWYESMAWPGMSSHVGGVRLATLRLGEEMAGVMADAEFAAKCQSWIGEGSDALETYLWAGTHYMIYNDADYVAPQERHQTDRETYGFIADQSEGAGGRSNIILSHQLDGEWMVRLHGLPSVFRPERTRTTLDTLAGLNEPLTTAGLLVVVDPSGVPTKYGGRMGSLSTMPASTFITAANFAYEDRREDCLRIAHDCLAEMVCTLGATWDMPNIMIGSEHEHRRVYGTDYYQCMSLWGLPAALADEDLAGPCAPDGLVTRMIRAGNA